MRGALADGEVRHALQRLHATQQIERAVEDAHVAVRRDDRRLLAANCRRAKHEAFAASALERGVELERRDEPRRLRRSENDRSVRRHALVDSDGIAEQTMEPAGQLVARSVDGRRARVDDDARQRSAILREARPARSCRYRSQRS